MNKGRLLTNGHFSGKKKSTFRVEPGCGIGENFLDDAAVGSGVVVLMQERLPAKAVTDDVLIEPYGKHRAGDAGLDLELGLLPHEVTANSDGDKGEGGLLRCEVGAGHFAEGHGLDNDVIEYAPAAGPLECMSLAAGLTGLLPEGSGLQHHLDMEVFWTTDGKLAAGKADNTATLAGETFEVRRLFK